MNARKCRVWNKQEQRMIYAEEAQEMKSLLAIGLHGLPIAVDADSFRDGEITGWNVDHFIIPLWSTGCKDKHGKEMYDGDIVRINHPHDTTGDFTDAIGEVFWWDEEGGWYHGNDSGRPPKRMWRYAEVIGNRYETPELLPEEAYDD